MHTLARNAIKMHINPEPFYKRCFLYEVQGRSLQITDRVIEAGIATTITMVENVTFLCCFHETFNSLMNLINGSLFIISCINVKVLMQCLPEMSSKCI